MFAGDAMGWLGAAVSSSARGDVTHPLPLPALADAVAAPAFICFLVSLLISSRNYYNLSAPPLILGSLLLQHKGNRLQQIRKIILRRNPLFSNFRGGFFFLKL